MEDKERDTDRRILAGVFKADTVGQMRQAAGEVGISFEVIQGPGERYPLRDGGISTVPDGMARVWITARPDRFRTFWQVVRALTPSTQSQQ